MRNQIRYLIRIRGITIEVYFTYFAPPNNASSLNFLEICDRLFCTFKYLNFRLRQFLNMVLEFNATKSHDFETHSPITISVIFSINYEKHMFMLHNI